MGVAGDREATLVAKDLELGLITREKAQEDYRK
jgi:hypothetical protein